MDWIFLAFVLPLEVPRRPRMPPVHVGTHCFAPTQRTHCTTSSSFPLHSVLCPCIVHMSSFCFGIFWPLFICFSPLICPTPAPASGNHQAVLSLGLVFLFRFRIEVRTHSICPCLSGLFHLLYLPSRSTHVVTNGKTFVFVMAEKYSCVRVRVCVSFSIHPPMDT